jgi:flagellar basal-body rod protein FlgB
MDMNSTGLMGLLAQKMAYLNQKQTVHAENVANASTPGYRAREIAPFTFDNALKQATVGMTVTDPRHIVPASMAGANSATVKVKSYDASPNGNDVDSEQEMMKMSQTGIQYQLVTTIYHKFKGLLNIALKGSA